MTMDTEPPKQLETNADSVDVDLELDDIITFLTYNKEICFKNQQKWEPDLTYKQKFDIALEIFNTNKLNFLTKFGGYLKRDQLDYFSRYTNNTEPDWEEIKVILKELHKNCLDNSNNKLIKNRRYEALKQMVQSDSYFSEIEMMKRNPLLYEQLIGQYMSENEKKERDKIKFDEQSTFVKILMEGIERENAELYKKQQKEVESDQLEEEDEDEEITDEEMEDRFSDNAPPSTSRWGEFEEDKIKCSFTFKSKPVNSVTAEERKLFKEEFVTTMYQNFLDGKDEDFDYDNVDHNSSYDNVNEIDHDEEDKYFESEEADEEMQDNGEVSSEDELDIYMNALNQHPAVTQLSKDLKKL